MQKIIVLDFGGQYCHLVARRIRQLNVYSEIMYADTPADKIKEAGACGIILSGGPQNLSEDDSLKVDPKIFELGVPVLGLCYGHQLLSFMLGGKISEGKTKEYGFAKVEVVDGSDLFKGLDGEETVWMSHGDFVSELPSGFDYIGKTKDCPSAAIADHSRKFYGLQFHPEVTHTPNGMKILENFVNVCNCEREWTMGNFIGNEVEKIKETIGKKKVFLLVSGGVDSTVAFSLLNKSLGAENVYGLHIDNGMVRKDESKLVKEALEKHGFKNFHVVDASQEFLNELKEVYDPEEKRKIIGRVFIEVYAREVKKLNLDPDEWILGQGTIYPDTIESAGTKNADLIKTHHNRVDVVQKLIDEGKVIEPLKELYKDEVRELGEQLGLPRELVHRHPFPGPGLGVRCLCAEKEDEIKDSDAVLEKTKKYCGSLNPVLLPVKSVGVQGDFRTYKHPVVLCGKSSWNELEQVSTDITNNVKDVNRVVLLVGGKLDDVNVKKSFIVKERLELLREADAIVTEVMIKHNIYDKIWQFPVVLLPIEVDGKECIVLRPVDSKEAMTAKFSRIKMNVIKEMCDEILKLDVGAIFYDVTNKPPGTIEWE